MKSNHLFLVSTFFALAAIALAAPCGYPTSPTFDEAQCKIVDEEPTCVALEVATEGGCKGTGNPVRCREIVGSVRVRKMVLRDPNQGCNAINPCVDSENEEEEEVLYMLGVTTTTPCP